MEILLDNVKEFWVAALEFNKFAIGCLERQPSGIVVINFPATFLQAALSRIIGEMRIIGFWDIGEEFARVKAKLEMKCLEIKWVWSAFGFFIIGLCGEEDFEFSVDDRRKESFERLGRDCSKLCACFPLRLLWSWWHKEGRARFPPDRFLSRSLACGAKLWRSSAGSGWETVQVCPVWILLLSRGATYGGQEPAV